jgi:HK97 family phage portal protein
MRSSVAKNNIDSVFIRNKQMLGVSEEEVMREPYRKSDLVYICISTTAKAVSQVPLIVVKSINSNGENLPLPDSDPWSQLFSRPNYITDRYSFIESVITYLLHDGEVFVIPYPPGLNPPSSLWVVRNKFIRPMKDPKTNLLMGWLYNQTGQFTDGHISPSMDGIPLHVDEVARIFLFNPYDPLKGMSPLEAGKMNVVVDYKAAFYTSVFFDEGASPGGVIATEQKLGDKQYNRTREQFEARHQGFRKAHRIALLEQGLKYTQTGLSQKDMEFGDLRKLTAERIYQIFGMKKAIVSVTEDVNYATAREERKEWWEGTNIPLMSMTASALNFILFRQNSNLKVIFDVTTVAALKEALKEKVDTAHKMWQMGFTANEINQRLDMGFGNKPWRNVAFVAVNLQPVDRALNPPEPTLPALPPAVPSPSPPPSPSAPIPPPKPPKALTEGEESRMSSAEETRNEHIWNNLNQKVSGLEDKFEKKVTRVFTDMRKRTLENLYKNVKAPKDVEDEFFSEDSKNISKFTDPIYQDALIVGFSTILEDIGANIIWNVSDAEAQAFLMMKNIQIKGILQTIKDQIRVELMEAYQNGETIDQIADRIRSVFNMSKNRARTIARTEIIGAANEGRHLAISRSGFGEKQWFTALDERVRPTHRAMHGKTVKVGDMWVMPSGASLRFPGDSNGPAFEVINCRCIEVVVPESHYLLQP